MEPFATVIANSPVLAEAAARFGVAIDGLALLAQEGGAPPASPLGPLFQALPLILLLFYFMYIMPQQRKDRRLREMIDGLKENDHVITTGGIFGVVTSVQRDVERVTLRVDDNAGTKLRVGLWAIAEVVNDDKDKDKAGAKSASKDKK